jgi:hypothetical protein
VQKAKDFLKAILVDNLLGGPEAKGKAEKVLGA